MLAAAGIVVTEISTPIRAPDLAEVSERTPAVPAKTATTKENVFGLGDESGQRVVDALEVGVDEAGGDGRSG